MRKQQPDDNTSHSHSSCFHTDSDVVMQLADMKDQTVYMKQFRAALGSALDEVKHLRIELAEEKSRGIEILKSTRKSDFNMVCGGIPQQYKQCTKEENENILHEDLNKDQETALPRKDLSEVIAESERRLDRVKDAMVEKRDLVRSLRKKLQLSSKTIVRRETKLEEKINQESDLKNKLQKLSLDKMTLEETSKKVLDELQQERQKVVLKEQEVVDLRKKLLHKEEQINDLYCKLGARDRELYETKNQLRNSSSSCLQCSWMREYIRKLEHNLQRYRYSTSAFTSPPDFPGKSYVDKEETYNSQWANVNALNLNSSSLQTVSDRNNWNGDANHKHHHYSKVNTAEAYRRQQALNRQRHQDFRNAAQVLSPIREDAEEPNSGKLTSQGKSETNSSQNYIQHKDNNSSSSYVKQQHTVIDEYSQDHNSVSAAPYFTVRSGERSPGLPEDQVEKAPTYFHVASGRNRTLQSDINKSRGATSSPHQIIKKKMSDNLVYDMTTAVEAETRGMTLPVSSAPDMSKQNLHNYSNGSSLVHIKPVKSSLNSDQPTSNTSEQTLFSYSHSLPLLNPYRPSPSSSVVSTTDDTTSDPGTTGCSSDSGISRKPINSKKVIKTRRAKRKPSRHVFFRNHKIDVTKFTMIEFRQIMLSICNDSKVADDFIQFLANEAKRLQSNPQWNGKHSLGTPEDWLSLKGSY